MCLINRNDANTSFLVGKDCLGHAVAEGSSDSAFEACMVALLFHYAMHKGKRDE